MVGLGADTLLVGIGTGSSFLTLADAFDAFDALDVLPTGGCDEFEELPVRWLDVALAELELEEAVLLDFLALTLDTSSSLGSNPTHSRGNVQHSRNATNTQCNRGRQRRPGSAAALMVRVPRTAVEIYGELSSHLD